jgi:hypothetical protein
MTFVLSGYIQLLFTYIRSSLSVLATAGMGNVTVSVPGPCQ